MSGHQEEVTYALDFCAGRQGRWENKIASSHQQPPAGEPVGSSIPRIARLMALAIRFDGRLRQETIQDYAELARLGRVTRARMTQIMKLRPPRSGHSGTDSLSTARQGPQREKPAAHR